MSSKIITVLLVLLGIGYLIPGTGVISTTRLTELYGVAIEGPNMEILMRHRAILFALLGAILIYAGFKPAIQPMVILGAFISGGVYLVLCLMVGEYNAELRKVLVGDIVGLVMLAVAGVLYALNPPGSRT